MVILEPARSSTLSNNRYTENQLRRMWEEVKKAPSLKAASKALLASDKIVVSHVTLFNYLHGGTLTPLQKATRRLTIFF